MSIEQLPMPAIATGGRDGNVLVHRDGKPPQVLQGHTDPVRGLSFCPTNPDLLASAGSDKTIVVWDIKNSSKIKTLPCPADLISVAWSSDGRYIAAACVDHKCYIVDAGNDYKQLCVLEGHTYYAWSVAFHPQNSAVCATASYDGTVRVWQLSSDSQQPECVKVLEHGDVVQSCCWIPDGEHLVSGGEDRAVRLWNTEDGTELAEFEGHSDVVESVAASPDGRMIASCSLDATCRIWEANPGGKCLQELEHPDAVEVATFSNRGHVVTGCCDRKLRVWSVAVGKALAELGGHTGQVFSIAVPGNSINAEGSRESCTSRF